jgi:hypothetical protein
MDVWWEDQWDKSKLKIRMWYKKDWKHYKYQSNINMWLQTGYQQEKEKRTRTWARTLLGWAVATGAVAWLQCGHSKNFMTLGKCLSQRITQIGSNRECLRWFYKWDGIYGMGCQILRQPHVHLSMRPSKTAKTPEEPDRQHFLVKAYS